MTELRGEMIDMGKQLSGRMDSMEVRLNGRIDRVEANLTRQIDGIDKRLDAIEIEKLPQRVAALEVAVGKR